MSFRTTNINLTNVLLLLLLLLICFAIYSLSALRLFHFILRPHRGTSASSIYFYLDLCFDFWIRLLEAFTIGWCSLSKSIGNSAESHSHNRNMAYSINNMDKRRLLWVVEMQSWVQQILVGEKKLQIIPRVFRRCYFEWIAIFFSYHIRRIRNPK